MLALALVTLAAGTGHCDITPFESAFFDARVRNVSCFRATTIALDWEGEVPCHPGPGSDGVGPVKDGHCKASRFTCTAKKVNPPGRTNFEKVRCVKGKKWLRFNYGRR